VKTFEYYKRGAGELDSSNFPLLVAQKKIVIEELRERDFVSLLTFNHYLLTKSSYSGKVRIVVKGYVAQLRSDKDYYGPFCLYDLLDRLDITCMAIQHESTDKITTGFIDSYQVVSDLLLSFKATDYTLIGCDASVHKFFAEDIRCANKIREDGKVTSVELDTPPLKKQIVLVDDLIGGGATIYQLVDVIRAAGYEGPLHLWVRYNEGIHDDSKLAAIFENVYIGDSI